MVPANQNPIEVVVCKNFVARRRAHADNRIAMEPRMRKSCFGSATFPSKKSWAVLTV